MNKCLRCGNEWEPKVENPKCCPGCKSPAWDRAKVSSAVAARVHGLVAKAKADGVLVVEPCSVCGSTDRIQAHHENYDNPLDVTWYCPSHHKLRHGEIGDALVDTADGKSRVVSLRIPAELLEQIDAAALKEDRSRNQIIALTLQRYYCGGFFAKAQPVSSPTVLPPVRPVFSPLSIPGVRLGVDAYRVPEEEGVESPGCTYTEYDTDSGETVACGKAEHGPKVKHGDWRKVK